MCHVSHVMCNVSRVTCHVSCVTCYVSPVTCHLSHVILFLFVFTFSLYKKKKKYIRKNIGQSGGASLWRVSYQRGLPRLVHQSVYYSTLVADMFVLVCSLDISHRVW